MSEAAKPGVDGALRIGVVGVGVMGSNHARVLSELTGVKLVGVVDPDRKQREHVARHLGCSAFADLGGLIERGVDAVTIAAPTHLHRDIAVDCNELNPNVFGFHTGSGRQLARSVLGEGGA